MIQKRYLKTKKVTKVTFQVDFAKKAQQVKILGDFTDWQPVAMKRTSKGVYKYTVELEPGQQYQYRYRIDDAWENDWQADAYEANAFGTENSVVVC